MYSTRGVNTQCILMYWLTIPQFSPYKYVTDRQYDVTIYSFCELAASSKDNGDSYQNVSSRKGTGFHCTFESQVMLKD